MKEDNSIHPNDTTYDHHEINIFLGQREERHLENYFACLSSLCACFNQQLQQVKPESREFSPFQKNLIDLWLKIGDKNDV